MTKAEQQNQSPETFKIIRIGVVIVKEIPLASQKQSYTWIPEQYVSPSDLAKYTIQTEALINALMDVYGKQSDSNTDFYSELSQQWHELRQKAVEEHSGKNIRPYVSFIPTETGEDKVQPWIQIDD